MRTNTYSDDPLVKSSIARKAWGGISSVTEWRWVNQGILPRPIKINGRNYHRRSTVDGLGGTQPSIPAAASS